MKINELVKEVNSYFLSLKAIKRDDGILIISSNDEALLLVPEKATNFMEVHFYVDNQGMYFTKANREYLSVLIEEFLHTPINDRFPEKEWYLCIGVNSKGHKVYLVRDYDAREIVTNINKDCMSPFTDRQVEELKKEFPKLAPAIDAMKEPVEDE